MILTVEMLDDIEPDGAVKTAGREDETSAKKKDSKVGGWRSWR